MSTRPGGFRVESGQLQQVARQYDDEGMEIAALKDSVTTDVGEGQVGRKFAAVAAPYRAAFEQFGKNLVRFGDQAVKISVRLGDVATAYARTEDANARRHREVY